MSRSNLSPNHCSCTGKIRTKFFFAPYSRVSVLRARNLHDKGKGRKRMKSPTFLRRFSTRDRCVLCHITGWREICHWRLSKYDITWMDDTMWFVRRTKEKKTLVQIAFSNTNWIIFRPIVDGNTPIKLTVYNNTKSSLSKGEFVGRAMISLRDLPDYDRVHTK